MNVHFQSLQVLVPRSSILHTWLGLALLVLLLVPQGAPALRASEVSPIRLSEPVAPGATLRQLAVDDANLAAGLAALAAEAARTGRIEVAVKTAVAFAPESRLPGPARAEQRRDIAEAAEALRRAMPKATRFDARPDMPYVILQLDSAGLARLENIPGLVRITAAAALNWRRDHVQLLTATRSGAGKAPTGTAAARTPQPRIVGGSDASPTTHPFQVGLLEKKVRSNFYARFCGGTLVSPTRVVTAGHCSIDVKDASGEVQVLVGTQRLDRGGKRIDVKRVTIHPQYNDETLDYDVAVWELAKPVTGIPFASLANLAPTVPGTPLRVTGWGRLDYSTDWYPFMLQQVDVDFVPTDGGACGLETRLTPRMFCAAAPGKDSCSGDSGGPITIDRGAGFTELVGIVSFGKDCALDGYPGVYANVAETSINRFIQDTVFPPPGTIEFMTASQSVSEGGRRVTLTVRRSSTEGTARLNFATAPGTALARSDFRARSGSVSFRRGQSMAVITISLVNDRVKESDETFTVTLSQPPAGWTLGSTATTTVTITDND